MSNPTLVLLISLCIGLPVVGLILIAVWDIFVQRQHSILHNFPVVGHLRYLLEGIGPELRQYWVANDKEELPFNRSERSWVYASAKGQNKNFGFGTSEQIYGIGHPVIKHATFPYPSDKAKHEGQAASWLPCAKVIGERHQRSRPYRPNSVVNISAMSFGSLGERAVRAMNLGVRAAQAYQNTGEGGVSPHHVQGGELIWQLGTGYFGARNAEGGFSMERLLAQVDACPQIRAIEIKLSQGAKPGKGGILPAAKVTPEIARIRGIPVGKDCYSPNYHSAFSNVDELIDFVEAIATESGVPVGIKSAIGQLNFWSELAHRMRTRNAGPDFIAVDGGEGGTGAAPLSFSDHVSLPFKVGFGRVYSIFQSHDMADQTVWIGSGKLGFPDRAVTGFAMGCDLINVAREAMLAIGCIQAQKCHTGHCPTGVATQSRWLQAGLNVDEKSIRVARYIESMRLELIALSHAAGYEHPCLFMPTDIELSTGVNTFTTLADVLGYVKEPTDFIGLKAIANPA